MPLTLYNTLTKREEVFVPADPKRVTMYTCGPTVYGRPHIGNYASFLCADLLRRWLEVSGYTVEHVKNITDVGHLVRDADTGEDKIQKEAEKEKIDPLEVAARYTDQYLEDERSLGLLEPASRPRATEYVEAMLAIIRTLKERGHAYDTADGVYFAVTTFPQYGALSGNTLDALKAGARIDIDDQKKHPADFALWKKCVGENASHILRWSFETGKRTHTVGEDASSGFPGWHIECSAMASSLLGNSIDIHTGGEDNIFPHHECEIAQSECAFGVAPFVRMWLHRRRIDLAGEKMSKSLGNVLGLSDIQGRGFASLDLRYLFLSVHYRTNLKFSWEGLEAARKAREKIGAWREEVQGLTPASSAPSMSDTIQSALQTFSDAMNSDLNTSGALASVFSLLHAFYAHSEQGSGWSTEDISLLHKFSEAIEHTFGCFSAVSLTVPDAVTALLKKRELARKQKDFAASDALRAEIATHGFDVLDSTDGQSLKARRA
ncbi:MAG: cysteine--tRNA ligase [Candidatus Peribacteraceae bacterium]